jgi:hypothetical protein
VGTVGFAFTTEKGENNTTSMQIAMILKRSNEILFMVMPRYSFWVGV